MNEDRIFRQESVLRVKSAVEIGVTESNSTLTRDTKAWIDSKATAEDSKAVLEFRDVITADRMSQRSSSVAGRVHSSQNSRFNLNITATPSSEELDPDLDAWKAYCVEAAREFKKKGSEPFLWVIQF